MKTWKIILILVLIGLAIILVFYMRQTKEEKKEIEEEISKPDVMAMVDESEITNFIEAKPDIKTMVAQPGIATFKPQ